MTPTESSVFSAFRTLNTGAQVGSGWLTSKCGAWGASEGLSQSLSSGPLPGPCPIGILYNKEVMVASSSFWAPRIVWCLVRPEWGPWVCGHVAGSAGGPGHVAGVGPATLNDVWGVRSAMRRDFSLSRG